MHKKRVWKRTVPLLVVLSLLLTLSPLTGLAAQTTPEEPPTTGFEDRNGESPTTHEEELAFLEELATKSERVTYSQIGSSVEGRPIHLVRVGYPEPPSDEEIAAGRNILIMGTPHGNEPAGREMTLKLMRDLAFTEEPELLDFLNEATVLFVPTPNPDGREANTRGNAWGVDNNRDHLNLETPEMQAIAGVLNQFHPDITVDAHERPRATGNPDIEVLWPRNLNVDEELRALNIELVQDYMRPDIEAAGFSTGLYGTPGGAGGGDERILRNMAGLRHGLGILTETAGQQALTDRVDAQMEAAQSVLRFYMERFDDVGEVVIEAPQRKAAEGADPSVPFYLDGADNWEPTNVLDPKPCGYLLTSSQAEAISRHMELFSIETERIGEDVVSVGMNQPMMTVVPFLVDERAAYNEVEGLPLSDCSRSAESMKALVEYFEDEGEISSPEAARLLKTHLTAVSVYEGKEQAEKVVKHLESLKQLLSHQEEIGHLSDRASHILVNYADHLLEEWAVDFDAQRAVDHIRHLSVEIGPRVAGTDEEKQAAEYIKNEFERHGYEVSTQEFEIRDDQTSQNVIAVKKPENIENPEIVYVTAHYDSVPDSPGANDNGSGTATLLELAKIMKHLPVNKEVRFVAFGAEEIGLVGSRYYVSQLSQEEMDRSVGNFNMDMVGTNWEPATQLYVNVVDGEPNLVWQSARAAADRLGNDTLFLYQRGASDHVAFHEVGIDAANFIWREPGTASLEPWYHTPQDTIDRISPEKIQMVGELINSAVSDLIRE